MKKRKVTSNQIPLEETSPLPARVMATVEYTLPISELIARLDLPQCYLFRAVMQQIEIPTPKNKARRAIFDFQSFGNYPHFRLLKKIEEKKSVRLPNFHETLVAIKSLVNLYRKGGYENLAHYFPAKIVLDNRKYGIGIGILHNKPTLLARDLAAPWNDGIKIITVRNMGIV